MLDYVYVNGFKSLAEFSVEFTPGLNVMIGPNGSGKTTICQALGLFAALANGNVEEYLLSIGGSTAVFTKCNYVDDEEFEAVRNAESEQLMAAAKKKAKDEGLDIDHDDTLKDICTEIYNKNPDGYKNLVGCLEIPKDTIELACDGYTYVKFGREYIRVHYEYDALLTVKDKFEISYERLVVKVINEKTGRLKQAFVVETKESQFKVVIKDKKHLGMNTLPNSNKKTHYYDRNGTSHSLFRLVSHLLYLGYCVVSDMGSINVYNIDPNVAKKTSDVLDPDRIDSSGKNLANNIYFFDKEQPEDIEELNDFITNLCPRYKKVTSKSGHSEGRKRTFSVVDDEGVEIHAHSLSDGTVKSIALYVAMLNSSVGNTVFEEPENYIHPWGCRLIIDHIRERYENMSCIITTHSETILNLIDPSEIIVCENYDGFTDAKRVEDQGEIKKAIEMSGFGCGYHYVTGAFGGTPE